MEFPKDLESDLSATESGNLSQFDFELRYRAMKTDTAYVESELPEHSFAPSNPIESLWRNFNAVWKTAGETG